MEAGSWQGRRSSKGSPKSLTSAEMRHRLVARKKCFNNVPRQRRPDRLTCKYAPQLHFSRLDNIQTRGTVSADCSLSTDSFLGGQSVELILSLTPASSRYCVGLPMNSVVPADRSLLSRLPGWTPGGAELIRRSMRRARCSRSA